VGWFSYQRLGILLEKAALLAPSTAGSVQHPTSTTAAIVVSRRCFIDTDESQQSI
jgi:hypothetical protein